MPLELAPGSSFAGYRIERLVGRGGMGAVYRATEVDGGRDVALKLILPDLVEQGTFAQRFAREARLTAELDSPHVVPLYEAGEADGVPFLAMRFVDGVDLETVLAAKGALHPVHAAGLVAQVATALDAAHAEGLVHRDVKPANVLLERRGEDAHAYLTDFGLSKHLSSQSGLTRTGHWVGTVDYAAPEQVQAGEVDARTDVYALGCMLHELVTGEVPFPRSREVSKLMAHVAEPPPRVTDADVGLPEGLDDVVLRAMAKAPEERFASAGELARAAVAAAVPAGAPTAPLLPAQASPDGPKGDPGAPTAA